MDIYKRKSRWKIALAVGGLVITLITMVYSNYLANKLKEVEENNVQLYIKALNEAKKEGADLTENMDITVEVLSLLNNIPVITEGEDGILEGYNFNGEDIIDDQTFLQDEVNTLLKNGFVPLEGGLGYANKVYYKNSQLYTLITYFPFVQFLLLASFLVLGYFGFNASRRAEQNRVWAGMAKETAHQLGTPISAILAWIEILKDRATDDDDLEIVNELTKDVQRLELVADRFSKIGSTPILTEIDMNTEIESCVNYMRRRSPQKVNLSFISHESVNLVNINQHLFDWVIENLIRNALDSLDGQGEIETTVYEEGKFICIDIKDTGSGIPSGSFNTVFQPGYSTKKRGWGLGLSLAKRIIESYHKGKIFIKKSIIDEGTTFTIKLPKA